MGVSAATICVPLFASPTLHTVGLAPPAGPGSASGPLPLDFVVTEYMPGGRNVVLKIRGDAKPKVSFCTMDFLGLGASDGVRNAAYNTMDEYTLGSCGPRGFYGTTRKHLELEETIAGFMGTPESITYSDSTATIASAIPAFAKRGDVLLVDSGANFGVMTGAKLSRSKVLVFRHNDMEHLESFLREIRDADETKVDDSLRQRRFIVVEGLYAGYGDICPLPDVLRLAREYKWRVMLDDSCGIGVLGSSGRGVTEHYGLAPLDIDVLVGSLATSFSSVGGFCVGSREVVDHQRLSGSGYCFSASAPPFLCATATAALRAMVTSPSLLRDLQVRCVSVHNALSGGRVPGMEVSSDPRSPIKHLRLLPPGGVGVGGGGGGGASSPNSSSGSVGGDDRSRSGSSGGGAGSSNSSVGGGVSAAGQMDACTLQMRRAQEEVLKSIVQRAAALGVLVTRSHAPPSELQGGAHVPAPSLLLFVTLAQTPAELTLLVHSVAAAAAAVLQLPAPPAHAFLSHGGVGGGLGMTLSSLSSPGRRSTGSGVTAADITVGLLGGAYSPKDSSGSPCNGGTAVNGGLHRRGTSSSPAAKRRAR